MHLYAFGSLCRGEVDLSSDVDLLAIVEGKDLSFDKQVFSIYSYRRIREIWSQGNPFVWHLYLEARLLFSDDQSDFLREMGEPAPYLRGMEDCHRFYSIFEVAKEKLEGCLANSVFELSNVFLSIRNFATCYSLEFSKTPSFSRFSALKLEEDSIDFEDAHLEVLETCRILSTRGHGEAPSEESIKAVIKELPRVEEWMQKLEKKVK